MTKKRRCEEKERKTIGWIEKVSRGRIRRKKKIEIKKD